MFNFQTVNPAPGGTRILQESIRLNKTAVSLGDEVLPGRTRGSKVGVRVDVANQAVYLFPDDVGYTMQSQDEGGRTSRYITCGSKLQKLGLLRGDYTPVEGQANVYQRATGATK